MWNAFEKNSFAFAETFDYSKKWKIFTTGWNPVETTDKLTEMKGKIIYERSKVGKRKWCLLGLFWENLP